MIQHISHLWWYSQTYSLSFPSPWHITPPPPQLCMDKRIAVNDVPTKKTKKGKITQCRQQWGSNVALCLRPQLITDTIEQLKPETGSTFHLDDLDNIYILQIIWFCHIWAENVIFSFYAQIWSIFKLIYGSSRWIIWSNSNHDLKTKFPSVKILGMIWYQILWTVIFCF